MLWFNENIVDAFANFFTVLILMYSNYCPPVLYITEEQVSKVLEKLKKPAYLFQLLLTYLYTRLLFLLYSLYQKYFLYLVEVVKSWSQILYVRRFFVILVKFSKWFCRFIYDSQRFEDTQWSLI